MAYREHGRTSWRFLVMGLLTAGALASAVLADACRVEGSLPLHRMINGDTVNVSSRRGITAFNEEQANGIIFYLHQNGDTISKTPFTDGKENGEVKSWYDDGTLKEIRIYTNGKKSGTHHGWYNDGTLKFEYNYVNDEFHGEYTEWYPNGELFRDQHFNMGHEEGMQTMYFPGGKIKSNYLIKNKRRYGLPGTQNCVNVADSIPR